MRGIARHPLRTPCSRLLHPRARHRGTRHLPCELRHCRRQAAHARIVHGEESAILPPMAQPPFPYVPRPCRRIQHAPCSRRPVRAAVRRVDRLSGPARRAHRQCLDSHRSAGDLGAEAVRWVHHPREQHRPDHRVGRRVSGGRRRVHDSGVDIPDAVRTRLLQLLPDHCRLAAHPRVLRGAAAARPHVKNMAAAPPRRGLRRVVSPANARGSCSLVFKARVGPRQGIAVLPLVH